MTDTSKDETVEILASLHDQATKASNPDAKSILSQTILQLSERHALDAAIKSKLDFAQKLIHAGLL